MAFVTPTHEGTWERKMALQKFSAVAKDGCCPKCGYAVMKRGINAVTGNTAVGVDTANGHRWHSRASSQDDQVWWVRYQVPAGLIARRAGRHGVSRQPGPYFGPRRASCRNYVELRGFEPLTPSMRTSVRVADVGRLGRSSSADRRPWPALADGVAVPICCTASDRDRPGRLHLSNYSPGIPAPSRRVAPRTSRADR
jgi:hypothetical protein